MMWQGPGFSRMLVVSNLRTPIRHTPYLQSHRQGQLWAVQAGLSSHFLSFSPYDLLFVSMKGGKGEALALVLSEEFTFLQANVMHLIGGAAPVGSVPLVGWTCMTLPEKQKRGLIGHVGKEWPLKHRTQSIWLHTRATSEDFPLKVVKVTSYISVRAADQYFNQPTRTPSLSEQ